MVYMYKVQEVVSVVYMYKVQEVGGVMYMYKVQEVWCVHVVNMHKVWWLCCEHAPLKIAS